MTDREIIQCINDGANFYLRFFGDAGHMEYHKNAFYSYIHPKQGEHGVRFVFNVKLENLPENEQLEKIAEIKSLHMPVWWDLQTTDGLYGLINGKDREKRSAAPADGDELYMAVLPTTPVSPGETPADIVIKKVETPAAFSEWAAAVNRIMFDGYADIHPLHHYRLCKEGRINCFSCYYCGVPVSFAAIMDNDKICSLEFVATGPNYRRRGFAAAVCRAAMAHAFHGGAKIITLRALQPGTKRLYTTLGYKIYNHAL